jgi:putative membrane protein
MKWASALTASALALALGLWTAQAKPDQQAQAQQGNQSGQKGQYKAQDYQFMAKAARIDQGEAQLGKLAENKGSIAEVRDFAGDMIKDHTKVNKGLKELAQQKGATLPNQLSPKQHSELQKLQGLSGKQFDKTYAQDMVKGHTKAVNEFANASKHCSDPDLRAWAQTTLPLLQEHLRMAKNMEVAVQNE